MKAAVLTHSSRSAGGLFYSVRWLSKALAERGCQPVIYSPSDEFSQEDLGVWDPLPVELYAGYSSMQFSPSLRKMLAGSDAELIHLHGIWMDNQWAALQHQKKSGTPVIVSPRGMLDPWAVKNAAWKKHLVEKVFARQAIKNATCIHALCRSEVESIREYGLKNPIALIPNGVEVPNLGSDKAVNRAVKGRKILFLGRIHPKKGLTELLKGWAKAKSEKSEGFSDWQLLVAGWDDGNHLEGLKELASQLGLMWSDAVSTNTPSIDACPPGLDLCFLGAQFGEEKNQLLQSVDAFILPSFSEGLPMSVLEAWGYRLPVVMTDFCNIPEGFEADAALRIEPCEESVAVGLKQLASMSDDDLQNMGINGLKLVEDRFIWPKIGKNMMLVYQWCLNGGNPPDCIIFN